MNRTFRNKHNFLSHPFPIFSEVGYRIHLEKETSSFSLVLFHFIFKEEKSYSSKPLCGQATNHIHLGLWLLRALCGRLRAVICHPGQGAGTQRPEEPLSWWHLPGTDHCQHFKVWPTSPWQVNSRSRPIVHKGIFLVGLWSFRKFSWNGPFILKCCLYINLKPSLHSQANDG